jgi:hypothetical protein
MPRVPLLLLPSQLLPKQRWRKLLLPDTTLLPQPQLLLLLLLLLPDRRQVQRKRKTLLDRQRLLSGRTARKKCS